MPDEWAQFKERAKAVWSLGDYSRIAELLEPVAVEIVDLCRLNPQMDVLDVAAGTGNVAIAAARKGSTVVASDLTPAMIDLGRQRTAKEGLAIEWQEADAEDLPFRDAQFDVVLSVFGAIFAPRPDRVTREMFRVVRDGGAVAMAAWKPDGWSGHLLSLMRRFLPSPPVGSEPPTLWGDPEVVRQRFQGLTDRLDFRPGTVNLDFPSLEEGMAFFESSGSFAAAKQALGPETYEELRAELQAMSVRFNRGGGRRLLIPNEYLLVLARKAHPG